MKRQPFRFYVRRWHMDDFLTFIEKVLQLDDKPYYAPSRREAAHTALKRKVKRAVDKLRALLHDPASCKPNERYSDCTSIIEDYMLSKDLSLRTGLDWYTDTLGELLKDADTALFETFPLEYNWLRESDDLDWFVAGVEYANRFNKQERK